MESLWWHCLHLTLLVLQHRLYNVCSGPWRPRWYPWCCRWNWSWSRPGAIANRCKHLQLAKCPTRREKVNIVVGKDERTNLPLEWAQKTYCDYILMMRTQGYKVMNASNIRVAIWTVSRMLGLACCIFWDISKDKSGQFFCANSDILSFPRSSHAFHIS